MSLDVKKKETKAVRMKLMGTSAKMTWAETDEMAEELFKEILKLRAKYRELGQTFKKH